MKRAHCLTRTEQTPVNCLGNGRFDSPIWGGDRLSDDVWTIQVYEKKTFVTRPITFHFSMGKNHIADILEILNEKYLEVKWIFHLRNVL